MPNTNINRKIVYLGLKYNPDAVLRFNAAGISNVVEKLAINTWYVETAALRAANKITAAYINSATSFSAAIYCWIRNSQATYTAGNSPNWSATNGFDFNGVNQFLKTGINASTDVAINNGGIGGWSLDDTAIGGTFMGCNTGASDRFLMNPENASNLSRLGAYDLAGTLSGTAGASNEFYMGYVVASNSRKLYRAQVEIATSSATVVGTPPNLEIYLGCSNTSGTPTLFSLRRMVAAFVTTGLSASDHNILEAATRNYLHTMGII